MRRFCVRAVNIGACTMEPITDIFFWYERVTYVIGDLKVADQLISSSVGKNHKSIHIFLL